MLSSLRNSERIFRRSILLPAVFLLAIGYTVYQRFYQLNIYFTYNTFNNYITAVQEAQGLAAVYFILFLFLSFQFIYKLRSVHLSECCRAILEAKPKIYLGQFSFLFFLAFLTTALHFAFDMTFYLINPVHSNVVVFHILFISLLNVLLVSVAAIFMGALLGIFCNRYVGYAALIGIALLATPVSDSLSMYFSITDPFLNKLKDLFFFMPSTTTRDVALTGGSIEASRWNMAFFWICLLGAIFLFTQYRRAKKRIVAFCLSAVFLLISGVNLGLFATSDDLLTYNRVYLSLENDAFYHAINPGKEKEAEFTVTGYRMDLDLRRKFSADCTVFLDNNDLTEYDFTLSYSYTLHSVTDKQGRPLSYVRDGDYLTVQNPYSSGLSEIHLSYSGNNTTYFVNNQRILLPAYFPYYPFAGFKLLFATNYVQGPLINTVDKTIKSFDISIQSSVPFVTNLTEKDGRYLGESEGMSIVGGLLEPVEIENISTFRPLTQFPSTAGTDVSYAANIQEELNQLYDYLQIDIPKRVELGPRFMILPGFFQSAGYAGNCQIYEDHVLFTNILGQDQAKGCAVSVLSKDINPDSMREQLHNIYFRSYLFSLDEFDYTFADITEALEQAVNEQQKEYYRLGHMLYQVKQRLGEQQAAIAVYNYLCDENDTRTPQQFLEEALA